MGRAVCVRSRRHHGGDQRLHRFRQGSLPPGHRRVQGPCRHAGQARHHCGGRCEKDRSRSRHDPVRDRGGKIFVPARARRHPHERGGQARRADRGGCRPPAHRALAQRPGGDRFPAVAARHHRCAGQSARGLSTRADREGAGACRHRDAGPDPYADRAAGDLRPSSARLCRDGGARPRPLCRRAQAAERIRRSARARSPAPRLRSTAT